jgi:hypothetical protein
MNRREFIKTVGIGAVGIAMGSNILIESQQK